MVQGSAVGATARTSIVRRQLDCLGFARWRARGSAALPAPGLLCRNRLCNKSVSVQLAHGRSSCAITRRDGVGAVVRRVGKRHHDLISREAVMVLRRVTVVAIDARVGIE